MGAFDQFKDKAGEFAEKAKKGAGDERDKAAQTGEQEMDSPERGAQERGSDLADRGRKGARKQEQEMGRESNDDSQDNWS